MANKKKISVVSLIVAAVLAVAFILTIVGICIVWLKTTTTTTLGNSTSETTTNYTLSDLLSSNSDAKANGADGIKGLGANTAFAIMTVVFCGLSLIGYIVNKFLNNNIVKWVVVALSALTVICAIVAFITAFTVAGNLANGGFDLVVKADAKTSPSAGAWLMFIFGLVGGGAGVFGALKA